MPQAVVKKTSPTHAPKAAKKVSSKKRADPEKKKATPEKKERVEKKSTRSTSKTPVAKKSTKDAGKQPKTKKVKPNRPRKIDVNSTVAEESGLNLSVARVKNIIDDHGLNQEFTPVAETIRKAKGGHFTKTDKSGKVIERDEEQTPVAKLPSDIKRVLKQSRNAYLTLRRREYERKWLKDLAVSKPKKAKAYKEARKAQKKIHDEEMAHLHEEKRVPFDLQVFNNNYDAKFYDNFDKSIDLPTGVNKDGTEWDEWKQAANCVGKMKIRFSANSKIYLTAFLETVVRAIALNGTYNCFAHGNKIVKIYHVFDETFVGNETRLPIIRLLTSLDAYKRWQERVNETKEAKNNGVKLEKVSSSSGTHPFSLYIGKVFKYVKYHLAHADVDTGVKDDPSMTKAYLKSYFGGSLGQDLKRFCSDVLVELLDRIGDMIKTSVQTSGVKTVTDDIIKTIISQVYSMFGMDFVPVRQFMCDTVYKYNKYITERREERKLAAATEAKTGKKSVKPKKVPIEEFEDDEEPEEEPEEDPEEDDEDLEDDEDGVTHGGDKTSDELDDVEYDDEE